MNVIKQKMYLLIIVAVFVFVAMPPSYATDQSLGQIQLGFTMGLNDEKKISLTLDNQESVPHTYAMTTEGNNGSYEIYYSNEGQVMDTVKVEAKSQVYLDMNIKKIKESDQPQDVILIKAQREDGQAIQTYLTLNSNQDYKLNAQSTLNKVDIVSGSSTDVPVILTNIGGKPLSQIQIVADLPYKWVISGNQDQLIDLKPGESTTVTLTVNVPSSQTSGNFNIGFKGVSDTVSSANITLPVTVKTNSKIVYIMLIGVLIIGLVTWEQFKKHGRR